MQLPVWISRFSRLRDSFFAPAVKRGPLSRRLLLELLEDRCTPAVLVTSLDDSGAGTLREAIDAASGPVEIEFAENLSGTINLASMLEIDENISIDGDNRITINGTGSGGSTFTSFSVLGSSLSLNGLTITGGTGDAGYGGAIYVYSDASLRVEDCTFSGNSAGQYGGAIFADGGLEIINSTFESNNALEQGGAIWVSSSTAATITGSTFVTNSVFSVSTDGYGGAIYVDSSTTIAITNSTFSQNSAKSQGGAVYSAFATASVVNATFYGNTTTQSDGGALYNNNGDLDLANTILVDNLSNGVGSDYAGSDPTTAVSNILTVVPSSGFDGTNIAVGSASEVINTTLADNGGPTMTFAIVTSGPALALNLGDNAAAINAGLIFDQRGEGFARIEGGEVDIGAFEYQYPAQTFVVNTLEDVVDEFDGYTSLREAIAMANSTFAQDTINFDSGLSGTITLSLGGLDITESLIITGLGKELLAISGDDTTNLFTVGNSGYSIAVAISDITLQNGLATNGAAINATNAEVTVTSVDFLENHANSGGGYGGAIYADGGTLTVLSSYFTALNDSAFSGGAIYATNNAVLNVDLSQFVGLTVTGSGGAIYFETGSTAAISNSTFSGNTATNGFGGAIYDLSGAGLDIYGSTFTENEAPFVAGFGGAVYTSGNATFVNSTFFGNSASLNGGGVYSTGANVTYTNTTIVGNSGGGVYFTNASGTVLINNSIIAGATSGTDVDGGDTGSFDTSSAYNLIGTTNNADFLLINFNTLNVNVSSVVAEELADNGGPTQTLALLPDSIAIDAGSNSLAVDAEGDPLVWDQRGPDFTRYFNTTTDIGAFEWVPTDVDVLINPDGTVYDDGDPIEGSVITLAPDSSVYADTVQQGSSAFIAEESLVIVGAGKNFILDNAGNEISGTLSFSNVRDLTLLSTGDVTITQFDVSGTINIIIDGDLIVPEDVYATLVLSGSIQANRIFIYGTLAGTGTVTGDSIVVTDDGIWSPGNSPGHITVFGDVDYSGGVIAVDIAGTSDSQFDVTEVFGSVNIDGATLTLNVTSSLFVGQTFSVLTSSTEITGMFANLSSGQISQGGVTFSVTNSGTSIILTVLSQPAPTNTTFVEQLYSDILGRSADSGGLNTWLSALAAGASREQIVSDIYTSTEHRTDQINQYYQTYLGRMADPTGLNHWLGQFASGASETDVIAGIMGSSEYFSHWGGTNESFIESLYLNLLGRNADANGLSHWLSILDGGSSRVDIATAFMNSQEYFSDLVDSAYEDILRRTGDDAGINSWMQSLDGGITPDLLDISFYSSAEYYSKT